MRKIGINLHTEPNLTDVEFIQRIAELGFNVLFSGVLDEERQLNIANLLAKHGLEYEELHAPFGHINDIWLEGDNGEVMLNELIGSVDRCAQVGAPATVVHLSSGMNPPPITDIGRARFARLVEHAQKKNVIVAFENQRQLANLAWALETFSAADSVGFCWDCGHESCFTPGKEFMPFFGDRLICTHIHDNRGVFDEDNHWLPFEGQINFTRFAEHIRAANYTGPLTLEVGWGNIHKHPLYHDLPFDAYIARAANAAKRLAAMVAGGGNA